MLGAHHESLMVGVDGGVGSGGGGGWGRNGLAFLFSFKTIKCFKNTS